MAQIIIASVELIYIDAGSNENVKDQGLATITDKFHNQLK